MLHDNHRVLTRDVAQQLRSAHRFSIGHACGGFVDQQQFGDLGQQHPDLKPLLLPVAQIGGQPFAVIGQFRVSHFLLLPSSLSINANFFQPCH